jgi:hypothetical protein
LPGNRRGACPAQGQHALFPTEHLALGLQFRFGNLSHPGIASFTIGGGNTLSTFVWGKLRTTLDPSINAIATILLLSTIGMSVLALRLTRYRG